jgi:Fur family zinc uptake transcriptional regulator
LIINAYNYCKEHGYRYTEPREQVLQILLSEQKPLSAYEILAKLSKTMKSPKPPTVYRAIQFWQEQGFIHCIESLKSYIACLCRYHSHGGAHFLICDICGDIKEIEIENGFSLLQKETQKHGFNLKNWTTEIRGECSKCLPQ